MSEIIIPDKKRLAELKRNISKDGKDKFHVLSDFDRTLTRAFYNSKESKSIISHLRNGNYLSEDYAKKAHELYNKYHPIEIDISIGIEEKMKKMEEWWKKHLELLIDSGFDLETLKKCVSDMIKEESLEFRAGAKELLNYLNSNKIPLVVISASFGDLIKEYLREKGVFYNNINVVGNNLIFDENGNAKGYEKIIHVFNKHEFEIHNLKIYSELLKRKNVMLLGDSLGDIRMIEGFPYENLIKIGFLNENVEKNLEEFKKNFDIIILNDGNFDSVNELISEIFN